MAATKVKSGPRFVRWIDEVTPLAIAKELGVTRWTVYGWRRQALGLSGGSLPNPRRLQQLILFSGGKLTAADIYPPQPKSKK